MTERHARNVQRMLHNWRGLPERELRARARGLRWADILGLLTPADRAELMLIQAELDRINRLDYSATTTNVRRLS